MKEKEPDFADNVGLLLTNFIWWWVDSIKGFIFISVLLILITMYLKS